MDPVEEYLTLLAGTLGKISRQEVWSAIEVLYEAWRSQKHVFIMGNGGSAATASHMANDLNKFTIVEGLPRFKALSLSDNIPLMTAWANDSSYESVFSEQVMNLLEAGDVVVAISTSGNSPNILQALKVAREERAITIGFTGDDGGKLKDLVDYCVFIPDAYIGRQEDGHMILDHMIASILRKLIAGEIEPIPGRGEK
ncbi:MAG: hypothetical protein A2Z16_12145 [Chloroflexi bacterium RBG_16_54_18]|nr:MAG: hypothetical protein A2Z16_12145 [Chloroflexi bacterium RBG_16_54_18]